ncbi:MAG: hypothetical protein JO069_17405, partial [Verrucomicrobia bacterium]|nr:hypothetical protein [Verrucomicrobiota bacterium]
MPRLIHSLKSMLPGVVLAMAATQALVASPGPAPVALQLNNSGIASLTEGGSQWVLSVHNQTKGDFYAAAVPIGTNAPVYGSCLSSTLTARDTVSQVYPWGHAQCQYTTTATSVTFNITITNDESSQPLGGVQLWLGYITFPRGVTPDGWVNSDPPNANNYNSPTVLLGGYEGGMLALVNENVEQPAYTRFGSRYYNGYPMTVTSLTPIPVGGSAYFTLSLRWGPPNSTKASLAPDVWHAYQTLYPQELCWADRRPIGSVLLASPDRQYPTNPRGWFNDKNIDVFTPAGLASFQARMLAQADQIVALMRNMNAQGCIVWDIEGEQWPQGLATYIGDPRLLSQLAPEMDPIADAFFQKITSAGFRAGVCIRDQQLTPLAEGPGYYQQAQPDSDAIFNSLDQRITYAQQRWGCTLFYVDSNGDINHPYDVSIFKRLMEKHPDCLLIPEAQTDQ